MAKAKKPWVLRRSSIHQRGMFAARNIEAGEQIIEYFGELIDKDESLERCLKQEAKGKRTGGAMVFIFDLDEDYDLDGNIPNNPAKYINHCCEHNCEAVNEEGRIFIYALQDIEEGQELTFDYGYDVEFYEDHPCCCGAPSCCGYIVAAEQRGKLKRKLAAKARKQAAEKEAEASTKTAPRKKKTASKAGKAVKKKKPGKKGPSKKATGKKTTRKTLSKKKS